MFSNWKGCPFTWSASAYFVCTTSEQNDEIMIFVEYAAQSFLNIKNQDCRGRVQPVQVDVSRWETVIIVNSNAFDNNFTKTDLLEISRRGETYPTERNRLRK